MHCEEIRDQFSQLSEPPPHIEECEDCRLEWEIHLALRALKAPELSSNFDQLVLQGLEERAYFQNSWQRATEHLARRFCSILRPVALAACLLLLLWLGRLSQKEPPPELRALEAGPARAWSRLPDAVPAAPLPGATPQRRRIRLVKGEPNANNLE